MTTSTTGGVQGPPWPVDPLPMRRWKRIMDLTGAVAVGVATAPIWIVAAILTRVFLGGPVIFRQTRAGIAGTEFDLIKFRTMTQDCDESGQLLEDKLRTHWWGSFLRRTSIDELPSLINVYRGDLSLVGPRPLFTSYLNHYPQRHAQRHQVRPGLTGLAQTNGRNNMPWDERFEHDLEYIENLSFRNDVKILWKTVTAVVSGQGADGVDLTEIYTGPDGAQATGQG